MSTITIHAEDYLAVAVREYAERMGKSVNKAVSELLASALHLVRPAARQKPSLLSCAGSLDPEAADELRSVQDDFSKVDAEMWK